MCSYKPLKSTEERHTTASVRSRFRFSGATKNLAEMTNTRRTSEFLLEDRRLAVPGDGRDGGWCGLVVEVVLQV